MKKSKRMKNIVAVIAAVGILGASGAAYAAAAITPAEAAAALTGKTIEEVNGERAAGKTYGTIAKDAGKLEEFKSQMLEQKKVILDERVKEGTLTQAQADEIYSNLKNNQANCDGTGSDMIGRNSGAGFGRGSGMGLKQGAERGAKLGSGMGLGRGRMCEVE